MTDSFEPGLPGGMPMPDFNDETTNEAGSPSAADSASSTSTAGKRKRGRPKGRTSAPRGGLTRDQRRRLLATARTAVALHDADDTDRELLAALLGTRSDEPAELAVAALSAGSAAPASVADLDELIATDEAERGITVALMDATRVKGLWVLLHGLRLVPAAPPDSDTKAALAAAEAVGEAAGGPRSKIGEVLKLAGLSD